MGEDLADYFMYGAAHLPASEENLAVRAAFTELLTKLDALKPGSPNRALVISDLMYVCFNAQQDDPPRNRMTIAPRPIDPLMAKTIALHTLIRSEGPVELMLRGDLSPMLGIVTMAEAPGGYFMELHETDTEERAKHLPGITIFFAIDDVLWMAPVEIVKPEDKPLKGALTPEDLKALGLGVTE